MDGLLQLPLSLTSEIVQCLETGQGTLGNVSHVPGEAEFGLGWVELGHKEGCRHASCSLAVPLHQVQRVYNWVTDIHLLFVVRKCICTDLTIVAAPQCELFRAPQKRPVQKREFIFAYPLLFQRTTLFQYTSHRTCETLSQMPTPCTGCTLLIHYTHMLFNILFIFLRAAEESFTNTNLIFTCGSV